ncbi:putative quinol monooxygenase [Roseibium sp.]|uniref:putative quinol monooxygenase n=1 Tax=Roseibium sp. TaxID=1936156 RepID=UPI003A971B1B
MAKLWVSAGIELAEGADLAATEAALARLAEETERKESGCLKFEVRQNRDEPHRFVLWECWVDDSALSLHFEMPHTQAYLAGNHTKLRYIEKLQPVTAPADAEPA